MNASRGKNEVWTFFSDLIFALCVLCVNYFSGSQGNGLFQTHALVSSHRNNIYRFIETDVFGISGYH